MSEIADSAPPNRAWSPASSLEDSYNNVVVTTDSRGLIAKTGHEGKRKRRSGRTIQYVSRHFSSPEKESVVPKTSKRRSKQLQSGKEEHAVPKAAQRLEGNEAQTHVLESQRLGDTAKVRKSKGNAIYVQDGLVVSSSTRPRDAVHELVPWQQVLAAPVSQRRATFQRLLHGINLDELSSDSSLTDVPDDIGPDPFESVSDVPPAVKSNRGQPRKRSAKNPTRADECAEDRARTSTVPVAVAESATPESRKQPRSSTALTKSPYFPHPHKHRPTFLSTLPFPPLHLPCFGLMQERLCHDPFRLLIATIFLNKTPGSRAMPVFFKLMDRYPTPNALASAEQSDVTAIIQQLGFQNQRARKCIAMAVKWVADPPQKGRRRRKKDYPEKGAGRDLKDDDIVDDQDPRVAWEISHLPGLGPYSHDSWRMFCRDELRGRASSYNGEGAGDDFEPEWKRVCPMDKELRAWMTWSWMKEGWVWNKETGQITRASDELMELARHEGNVVLESEDQTLKVHALQSEASSTSLAMPPEQGTLKIDTPAGKYVQ